MHGFGKPKHSVNLLVFRRDKGISRKSYKKLVRGAIRLPIIFFRLNEMLTGEKKRKFILLMKLAISNFRCPGETHITNFTRWPLMTGHLKDNLFVLTALQGGLRGAVRDLFLAKKWPQNQFFFTLHLYNPPFLVSDGPDSTGS